MKSHNFATDDCHGKKSLQLQIIALQFKLDACFICIFLQCQTHGEIQTRKKSESQMGF